MSIVAIVLAISIVIIVTVPRCHTPPSRPFAAAVSVALLSVVVAAAEEEMPWLSVMPICSSTSTRIS